MLTGHQVTAVNSFRLHGPNMVLIIGHKIYKTGLMVNVKNTKPQLLVIDQELQVNKPF